MMKQLRGRRDAHEILTRAEKEKRDPTPEEEAQTSAMARPGVVPFHSAGRAPAAGR